jgi:hypothetical protein
MPLCLGENGNCASLFTLTDFFWDKNQKNPLKRHLIGKTHLKLALVRLYSFTSISTPAGKSSFIRASMVLEEG